MILPLSVADTKPHASGGRMDAAGFTITRETRSIRAISSPACIALPVSIAISSRILKPHRLRHLPRVLQAEFTRDGLRSVQTSAQRRWIA
jgi:hypothetical protein